MGSLAEMALKHARLRLKGQVKQQKPRASQVAATHKPAQPKNLEVVITGPINHLMFLEGRSWAVDMVASLRAAPADVVIERLAGATSGRPGSYAAGIQSVINDLRGTGSA